MNFKNILVQQKEFITYVTINRPKKLNALNKETIEELSFVFKEIEVQKEVKVVILTGAGEKAFVAGADISEFVHFSEEEGANLAREGQETLFNFIESMSIPVIAAVNGFALGGGLELAMCCHLRIASLNAKMGLPEVSLGVIPGYGGTQRLPQLVGKGKAMEMILTAGMITAEEAQEFGLVNYAVTQEELLSLAEKLASKIVRNSSMAIKASIKAINAGYNSVNGYDIEIEEFGNSFKTIDFIEGTGAFLEKRKPKFK